MDGIREALKEYSSLPVDVVWHKDEALAEELRQKKIEAKEKKISSRANGNGSTQKVSTVGIEHLPSVSHFRNAVEESAPHGVDVVRTQLYSSKLGTRRIPFAEIEAAVDEDVNENVRNWREELSAQYGIGTVINEIHAPARYQEILQELSDSDDLITDPKRVHEAYHSIAGMRAPIGVDAAGKAKPPRVCLPLEDEVTITIDSKGDKDLEDAWSAMGPDANGNILVRIKIINAAWMVEEGSEVDQYTKRLGQSIYAGRHYRLPIFGEDLAYGPLAFVAGEPRRAFTVDLLVDPRGKIGFTSVVPKWAMSTHRLDPDVAQGIIDGVPHEAAETVIASGIAAGRLRARRLKGNKNQLRIERSNLNSHITSYGMVEEFMIAARKAIAEYCKAQRIPIPYKVHAFPDRKARRALQKQLQRKGFSASMGRDLTRSRPFVRLLNELWDSNERALYYQALNLYKGRSQFKASPSGHRALQADFYTEIKGRHDAGLFVHRQLDRHFDGLTPKGGKALEKAVKRINKNRERVDERRFLMSRLGRLEYALETDRPISATVTAVRGKNVFVSIPQFPRKEAILWESLRRDGRERRPGEVIDVTLQGYARKIDRLLAKPVES